MIPRTPFSIKPYVDAIHILDANGRVILHLANVEVSYDEAMPPEIARFVVRACNAHAASIAAMKAARESAMYRAGVPVDVYGGRAESYEPVIKQLDAAIRLAEEGR